MPNTPKSLRVVETAKLLVISVIKITISMIALCLSWNCTYEENMVVRIILALVAFLFSELYIVYYTVYRVFMGNKCYTAVAV